MDLSPLPKPKNVARAAPMGDAVMAPRPLPTDLGSLQSGLKKSNSRPPSKSRGRAGFEEKKEDRSRSRASPERVKPSGALPSYLVDARTTPSFALGLRIPS